MSRKYFLDKKYHSVFDYGCGRGKDFNWLKENGYKATCWDPHWKPLGKPGPEEKFDVVLVLYVLNVIPDPKERVEVIKDAWNYVAPGGFLLISTRTTKEIRNCARSGNWDTYADGYVSSADRKTFQKGFTGEDLRTLFKSSCSGSGYVEDETREFSYVLASKQSEIKGTLYSQKELMPEKKRKKKGKKNERTDN